MSELFDEIVEAMSRASIGDLSARVDVPDAGDDQLRVVGEMLNVLLGDIEYRVRESRSAFRADVQGGDRRRADDAINERRGPLERIIEAAGEAIWVLDAAGHTILVNPATELMTGRSRLELMRTEPQELLQRPRAGIARRERPLRETVVFGTSHRVLDEVLTRPDGVEVPVVYTSQAIFDDAGAQIGTVLVIRDVTSEREAEERKTQFLAMASHELRTPLTAIKGFADTLVHGWDRFDDDSRLAFLRIIDAQSDRLVRLINDVLTLAQLERGALGVDPSSVRVRDVLERVQAVLPERFEIDCAPDLRTFCDEDHLEQIVLNYASNAIKYGAQPFVMEAVADGDNSVRIAVVDRGDGVPEAFRSRLFERFAQAERRPEGAGTGLGLSIAERLAGAQGGRAWFEPVEPHGARFLVRVPRAIDDRS